MMSDDLLEHVRKIQASMMEPGKVFLSAPELEALRCIVRLTVEFFDYLQKTDFSSPDYDEL
jgi:hypothetical protein